jgi:hypothetical protein
MCANSKDVAAGAEPPLWRESLPCAPAPGAIGHRPLHWVGERLGHAVVSFLLLLRLG